MCEKSKISKRFESIPGGAAGAVMAIAVVAFLIKDYFADFKANSDKLSSVYSQQLLVMQQLSALSTKVGDIEVRTESLYSYRDAEKDRNINQRQMDAQHKTLNILGEWKSDADKRLSILEEFQKKITPKASK